MLGPTRGPSTLSRWVLTADLYSARALAWLVTREPDAELTAEAHWFFYDRYTRLAEWHHRHGHPARARRLSEKAERHLEAAGGDGPPYAAAMALPRPARWTITDAVSRTRTGGPPAAASRVAERPTAAGCAPGR